MKKTPVIAASLLGMAALMAYAGPKDPILMTVGNRDVPVSEFEYLRNKNNSQQQQPQSLDEYVDLFVNYRLKVAAAEAAGLDTTATFLNEYTQFKNDLARPYLVDKSVEEALIEEAYNHQLENVTVSHIMLDGKQPGAEALADSLLQLLQNGTANYEDLARRYSVDRGSSMRGGLMGSVVPGRYPWAFEKASYDTPVGSISGIVDSGFGLHIIRVEKREPAKGEVSASHILRQTRNLSEEAAAAQKALIDSLYTVAKAGGDFADLARRFSEDPGSARNGGSLGFFSPGMMVQPFDSIAFALNDGELSEPFQTNFGWHIIYRTGHKGIPTLDEQRAGIKEAMQRDERSMEPQKAYIASYIAKHNGKVEMKNIEKLVKLVPAAGLDEATFNKICESKLKAYQLGKKSATLGEVLSQGALNLGDTPADVKKYAEDAAIAALDDAAMEEARAELAQENPEYRNLLNEYRDGILLYNLSSEKVWDRAANDKAGLEKFFKQHASNYKWETPKFKSIIIFANNDSTLNAALSYAETLADSDDAGFVEKMRSHFGRDVKVERVIAAKGENAITDYLAFGGAKPETKENQKWQVYAPFRGRIIEAPEEAADVRGLAVSDYQAELEKEWLDELHKTYKVEINQSVLDSLRK